MVSGDKDVEARVGVGTAAAVREGHLILLGDIRVRVLEVKRFADAAELLQHLGIHRVFRKRWPWTKLSGSSAPSAATTRRSSVTV